MVSGSRTLLLFDDDEGTRLWLTSNGITWSEVALPQTMSALGALAAVDGRAHYVAMFNNKFAGGPNASYGESDEIWTSTNGQSWTQAVVPGFDLRFDSLTVNSAGFRLVGTQQMHGSVIWTSSNGTTWKATS